MSFARTPSSASSVRSRSAYRTEAEAQVAAAAAQYRGSITTAAWSIVLYATASRRTPSLRIRRKSESAPPCRPARLCALIAVEGRCRPVASASYSFD